MCIYLNVFENPPLDNRSGCFRFWRRSDDAFVANFIFCVQVYKRLHFFADRTRASFITWNTDRSIIHAHFLKRNKTFGKITPNTFLRTAFNFVCPSQFFHKTQTKFACRAMHSPPFDKTKFCYFLLLVTHAANARHRDDRRTDGWHNEMSTCLFEKSFLCRCADIVPGWLCEIGVKYIVRCIYFRVCRLDDRSRRFVYPSLI